VKGQRLFVRETTPADEDEILELYRLESLEPPVEPGSSGLIARLVGDLVGHLTWTVEGQEAVITHVHVRADLRRKHIGLGLIRDAASVARSKGIERLVVSGTCPAHEFFLRTGFAKLEQKLVMEVS